MEITSLRDRVLQRVIYLCIQPVVEFQADSLSFGFREGRRAHQAVSIIADSMFRFSKINQPTLRARPIKCDKSSYDLFEGRKTSIKGANIGGPGKAKRDYKINSYRIYKPTLLSSEASKKQYTPYLKYLNVSVLECFDNISHTSILNSIPLNNKYLFLIKAWLSAPIVGPESFANKKLSKVIPTVGVSQNSIIGPIFCNIVLDGLETEIYSVCLKNPHYILNSNQIMFAKEKVGIKNINIKRETNIQCIRFVDNIIIFGLTNKKILTEIKIKLVAFLAIRGLRIKKANDDIQVFCPGNKFNYLGFSFVYPDYKKDVINKGKFTKLINNISTLANYKRSSYLRANPYICISDKKIC